MARPGGPRSGPRPPVRHVGGGRARRRAGRLSCWTATRQVSQLEAWRAVLGTLARPGTPLRRIQWVHRSAPAAGSRRVGSRASSGPPTAVCRLRGSVPTGWVGAARQSYRQLVADEGIVPQTHRAWLVLAVGGAHGRSRARPRRPAPRAAAARRPAPPRRSACRARPSVSTICATCWPRPTSRRSPRFAARRSRPWPMATDETWSASAPTAPGTPPTGSPSGPGSRSVPTS